MIYNMLTLSIQLLLIGFFVGVTAFYFIPKGRSQLFVVELALAVLGSFLGAILEVMFRGSWNLAFEYYVVLQFLVPLAVSAAFVAIYRLANSFKD